MKWPTAFSVVISMVCTGGATAQNVTISPSPLSVPKLGVFVVGTTTSTYSVNAGTGAVSRTSGDAFPISKSGAVNTITITCTSCQGNVGNRTVNVTVTAGAPAGRFSITSFSRSNTISTTGTTVTGATTGFPLTVRAVFPNTAATKTLSFRLGMTFQIAATGGTGARPINYTVTAARANP